MNTKKKFPLFWAIYAGVLVFLIALLILGSALLRSFLAAFEASQPVHFAENIYQTYFQKGAFEEALTLAKFKTGPYETLSDAAKALDEMREGKLMDFHTVSAEEGKARYNVVLVDPEDMVKEEGSAEGDVTAEMKVHGIPSQKIATLYFEKSKTRGDWGFAGWDFVKMELFPAAQIEEKVTLPSTYTLFINGNEVKEDTDFEISDHMWNDFLPDGVEGITLHTFTLSDLYQTPTLSVKDENGNEAALTKNEETGIWESKILFAEAEEGLPQRLLTGMKEYAKYIQADGSIGSVSPYFDTASEFYRNTALNPAAFVWDHNGYAFENEVVEDFYYFDENTLCCHISFDQHLKKTGREDYVDNLDMTIFARKIGRNWRIYDRIVR